MELTCLVSRNHWRRPDHDELRYVGVLFTAHKSKDTDKRFPCRSEFGLDLDKDPNLSGKMVSVMQAGAVIGALLAEPLADWRGRKPGLMTVAVFAFIGGLLQALSYGHLACFYVGR